MFSCYGKKVESNLSSSVENKNQCMIIFLPGVCSYNFLNAWNLFQFCFVLRIAIKLLKRKDTLLDSLFSCEANSLQVSFAFTQSRIETCHSLKIMNKWDMETDSNVYRCNSQSSTGLCHRSTNILRENIH